MGNVLIDQLCFLCKNFKFVLEGCHRLVLSDLVPLFIRSQVDHELCGLSYILECSSRCARRTDMERNLETIPSIIGSLVSKPGANLDRMTVPDMMESLLPIKTRV